MPETLTLKDVRDVVDDSAFWTEMRGKVLTGALASARKLVAQGIEAAASTGVIVDFDAIHQEAVAITRRWTDSWWEQLEKTTRAGLREAILQWETVGLGKRGLPDLIDAIEPLFGRARAKRIAVTEATRLFAEGNKLAYRGDDAIVGEIWQTAADNLVCAICGPRNNKIWPKGSLPPLPAHPQCRCSNPPATASWIRRNPDLWQGGPIPQDAP
ncbi:MAG: hypothetical protein Q8R28_00600 [Dehalococcoidia bacterium]|nr:hypothetical protein [Dehalococcoidia bacterium]